MQRYAESPITGTAPFVASVGNKTDDGTRNENPDAARWVLWQATGIIIDDTDFGSGTDPMRSRFWFPPCSWAMSALWWARMREAAERVEEALRAGANLRIRNFAEKVVLAAVLNSDAPQEVIDYLGDERPEEYAALIRPGDADHQPDFASSLDSLEFRSVLTDMLDDTELPWFLYPDDLPEASANGDQPTVANLEHWFSSLEIEHSRTGRDLSTAHSQPRPLVDDTTSFRPPHNWARNP